MSAAAGMDGWMEEMRPCSHRRGLPEEREGSAGPEPPDRALGPGKARGGGLPPGCPSAQEAGGTGVRAAFSSRGSLALHSKVQALVYEKEASSPSPSPTAQGAPTASSRAHLSRRYFSALQLCHSCCYCNPTSWEAVKPPPLPVPFRRAFWMRLTRDRNPQHLRRAPGQDSDPLPFSWRPGGTSLSIRSAPLGPGRFG